MGDLFLLSERQMARISPYFPLSHGVPHTLANSQRRLKREYENLRDCVSYAATLEDAQFCY